MMIVHVYRPMDTVCLTSKSSYSKSLTKPRFEPGVAVNWLSSKVTVYDKCAYVVWKVHVTFCQKPPIKHWWKNAWCGFYSTMYKKSLFFREAEKNRLLIMRSRTRHHSLQKAKHKTEQLMAKIERNLLRLLAACLRPLAENYPRFTFSWLQYSI